jgi:hypothetical protein
MNVREIQSKFRGKVLKEVHSRDVSDLLNSFDIGTHLSLDNIRVILDGVDDDGVAITSLLSYRGAPNTDFKKYVDKYLDSSDVSVAVVGPDNIDSFDEACEYDLVIASYLCQSDGNVRGALEKVFSMGTNVAVIDFDVTDSNKDSIKLYIDLMKCFSISYGGSDIVNRENNLNNVALRAGKKLTEKHKINLFMTSVFIYSPIEE